MNRETNMAQPSRKLIVHAGMHKTGSTAIQHWLHNTKLPDIHYFKWRNANHSDLFVLLFEETPHEHPAFARSGYTKDMALKARAEEMSRIRRQIEEADKEVFVFSAERISTAPDEAVQAMHDFFCGLFAEIEVFAYVRKPSGFMTSMFQQHLKTGSIKLSFGELWPGYRRRLRRLFKIFGRGHVRLRSYDALVDSGTEIVGDFARWTGLSTMPPSDIVLNWSTSATGMALLYFYRKHVEPDLPVPDRARFDRYVLYAAQTIPGEPFHIDLACERRHRRMVARDMRWISKRMGSDFDDLGDRRDGRLTFSSEEDIVNHAVARSHELVPWKELPPLDPADPESFAAARQRFATFLSPASRARLDLRRGVNWMTGGDVRPRT